MDSDEALVGIFIPLAEEKLCINTICTALRCATKSQLITRNIQKVNTDCDNYKGCIHRTVYCKLYLLTTLIILAPTLAVFAIVKTMISKLNKH